jgi:crotonobetainyl-CoA:carnitine CoA-transferase CaiB-like acyl-CoA transferase
VAAPTVGQHTHEVLREALGYDEARLASLAQAGAFGPPATRHETAGAPA